MLFFHVELIFLFFPLYMRDSEKFVFLQLWIFLVFLLLVEKKSSKKWAPWFWWSFPTDQVPHFFVEKWEVRVSWRWKGIGRCSFCTRVGIFTLMLRVLFPFCTLTWRGNKWFPPTKMYKQKKQKYQGTTFGSNHCTDGYRPVILYCGRLTIFIPHLKVRRKNCFSH